MIEIEALGFRDDFIAGKRSVRKRTGYNFNKFSRFEKTFILAQIIGCKVDDFAEERLIPLLEIDREESLG